MKKILHYEQTAGPSTTPLAMKLRGPFDYAQGQDDNFYVNQSLKFNYMSIRPRIKARSGDADYRDGHCQVGRLNRVASESMVSPKVFSRWSCLHCGASLRDSINMRAWETTMS